LEDLQQMLQSVLFPASIPISRQFNLTKDDDGFLYQYLSQFPGETNYPNMIAASTTTATSSSISVTETTGCQLMSAFLIKWAGRMGF
jgi:hypothetical protein